MTFADRVKNNMAAVADLSETQKGTYNYRGTIKKYDHIYKHLKDNFIDKNRPEYCNVYGNLCNTKIKYHRCSNHMNSSQVMCILFFSKLFNHENGKDILSKLLKEQGLEIDDDVTITDAAFEYIKNPSEGTNFDFYMKLSNGRSVSFEIKYTESGFGTVKDFDSEKYCTKWDDIYKSLVSDNPYLENEMSPEDFYMDYQINRNIVLAEKPGDHVIFLTPRANESKNMKSGSIT